ncbi:hypothetical protein AB6A40_002674 [Gnathostoma spinigerum]|uniref:Folliculin n=1 Tax=Gnathostoma spinigerum TaxID=75299 RepID=A0ABD6E782_9BILA
MEAHTCLSVYEALEDSSHTLKIALRDPCPVSKIAWSSFDYMTGPELRFVFEVVVNTTVNPADQYPSSISSSDSLSASSSASKGTSTVDYEEIDDVFSKDLLTSAVSELEVCPICMRVHESNRLLCDSYLHKSPKSKSGAINAKAFTGLAYLDDFMTDSQSTLEESPPSILENDDSQSDLLTSTASTSDWTEVGSMSTSEGPSREDLSCSVISLKKQEDNEMSQVSQSPVLLPSSQFPDTLRESPILLKNSPEEGHAVDISLLNITKASQPNRLENRMDTSNSDFVLQTMKSSTVDSGIAGTTSMHSDMSNYSAGLEVVVEQLESGSYAQCSLPTTNPKLDEGFSETAVSRDRSDSEEYENTLEAINESCSITTSDEEFIAKSVLAEQICSTQMPSNPMLQKITIVPSRQLLASSFLFPVKRSAEREKAMCAISVLMNRSKLDWYMKRQNTIEMMFTDIVPRLKAAYLTECFEDLVCRMMMEFTQLLRVLGVAENYPLYPSMEDFKLKNTYFMDYKLQNNKFLARALTCVLQSQGYCVIIGDDYKAVSKLLNTLGLFVAEENRWCCVRCVQHSYSPYLRLQAVQRSELSSVIANGVECHWPVSIIDIDRRLVCVSLSYPKHRLLKLTRQKEEVKTIIEASGVTVEGRSIKSTKLEMHGCRTDPHVKVFLHQMDLLPREHSVRYGFVRQFLLLQENRAKAFITFVKEVSKPNNTDKQNPISCRWSLSSVRKALDLTADSTYAITLAQAELIQPDIAQFIYETRTA